MVKNFPVTIYRTFKRLRHTLHVDAICILGNFSKDFFDAGLSNVQGRLTDGLPPDILESFLDVILKSKLKGLYLFLSS